MTTAPLHVRVSEALDAAGHRVGAELLAFIESRYQADAELIAECRALFSGESSTVEVLDSVEALNARSALEALHARLTISSTLGGSDPHAPASVPDQLGDYRILSLLGEGGMGLVYEAEQKNPQRRVALKVIRSANAGRLARARFRNEAQALAQLKHPGIAQVIEAATDPRTNDAFFVMEFVDGPTLTAHAAQLALGVRERVALLAQVCDAVQHAHQKGVIHRDLKPANILVETQPGAPPQPKVLDFGVAKLTEDPGGSSTLALDAGKIVGTLGYMSPEALEPSHGIDTRADVYALGVILYELLAGTLPIDVRGATITDAARRVREQSPAPFPAHRRELKGDLQAIVSTALAKDRERRYASAAELAADLRRFLRHEPITARPPGTLDALAKFVRRQPALAATVALSALALTGAAVFSSVQYLRAERRLVAEQTATRRADSATSRAEAVKQYFVTDLIAAASPERLGADAKVIDVLDAAYAAVPQRFADQPELRAELTQEFSGVYDLLGRFQPAADAARAAMESRRALYGEDDARTIESGVLLCVTLNSAQKFDQSEPLIRELLPRAERLPKDNPAALRLAAALGNLLQSTGREPEAVTVLTEAARKAESTLPESDAVRVSIRGNLAATLMRTGKVDEAVGELRKLVDEQAAHFTPNDPAVLSTLNNLIVGLLKTKRYDEAVTRATDLVSRVESSHPAGHPAFVYSRSTLAAALQQAGRLDEALPIAKAAHAAALVAFDESSWETETCVRRLVTIESRRGDMPAARAWSLEAQKIRCFASGPDERDTLLKSFRDEGKRFNPEDAEGGARALVADLTARADELVPDGHPRRAKFFANLARSAMALNAADPAPLLDRARAARPASKDEDIDRLLAAVRNDPTVTSRSAP